MNPLAVLLEQFLQKPTPDMLWQLHPMLLASDHPAALAADEIAGQFFRYLNAVRSQIETRQFPVLATTLAVSSTGINIAEEIFSARKTNQWEVVADGLRLALDTLSTYQFVRQWETNFAATHDAAVWDLYGAYWRLSEEHQPEMDVSERARLLDELFAVVRDPNADNALRLAMLVRLFQWGLLARLAPMLSREPTP